MSALRCLWISALMFSSGCAYRFGYSERTLPGGYEQIAVPVFANLTMEPGIETYFTNEIVRQFMRSKVAKVAPKDLAQVTLEGQIDEIKYESSNVTNTLRNLPRDAVLSPEYRLTISASIVLRRNSDRQVIWQSRFRDEMVYTAPQIALPVVNTANPLYNHRARHQNIAQLAQSMMAEAHDRMTENF